MRGAELNAAAEFWAEGGSHGAGLSTRQPAPLRCEEGLSVDGQETGFELLDKLRSQMDEAEGSIRLAEAILRIRRKDGQTVPLRANAAQRIFEQRRGQHNIVLKARQMGLTTWIAGRFFLRTALCPGASSLLVAHNRESAEMIFGVVRRMWETLPRTVREAELRLRRANAGEMVFAETGSEFRVASAADANAGRGLSVHFLHCSEVSRWSGDAAATLAGLRAALVPHGELVLESTPNGAYGAFYEEWKGGTEEARGTGLVRHFFPWWMEPTYTAAEVRAETLTGEEADLMTRHGLDAGQIGFRRELQRGFGRLRLQEFAEDAESCFRTAGSTCFEQEIVERRLREAPEPVVRRRNGALLEWWPLLPGRRYLMAVDTAGGGPEGDFAAVQVIDLVTGVQCAELQERLRPAELAEIVAGWTAEPGMAGLIEVVVERNNHGAAVLALLEQRPGVKLYRQNGQAGWLTTAASKPEVIARLGLLLQEKTELFQSRRLLGECRTFVSDAQGRAGAASGQHDDLVMAMAMAQAVRAERLPQSAMLQGGCV